MSLHDYDRIKESLTEVDDPVSFLVNLFAHAPVGFSVWGLDGAPVVTNRAFRDLFGAEPPPGYNVFEDSILANNGMLASIKRAFAGETVHVPSMWFDPRELTNVNVADGQRVAISVTLFPLLKQGAVEYVAATYKNETEIMLAAELVRLSEERVRLAQLAGRIGTFEFNVQTGVNSWTAELEALYGLEPGSFGRTLSSWETLVHPDDRERANELVRRAHESLVPVEGEWRVIWPDGTVHWLFGRFQMFEDATGRPHRLVGVNLDITDRKRAEAATRDSDARKSAVMEAALDPIVIMDHEGTITDINDAAERVLGYRRAELVGRSLAATLVPPSHREAHTRGFERYLHTGEQRVLGKRIEVPVLRGDGTTFPAEVAVLRIRSEGPPLFTGYIRDLSERHLAEEAKALRLAKETAEAANRELESFSRSVAHDLRAPLRWMSSYAGILREEHASKLDDEGLRLLSRIGSAASRMHDIIESLLTFSQVSGADVGRSSVDIAKLVTTIFESHHAAEPQRDVRLVLGDCPDVVGDPPLLRTVLENLLANAWKFTRDRQVGLIEVGGTVVDNGVEYYVRDNGIGFNMASAGELFMPFHRLHAAKQFEGVGLGLAIVARIIERHRGSVWAESFDGNGATFHFRLPR